jgi:hypothetical protein
LRAQLWQLPGWSNRAQENALAVLGGSKCSPLVLTEQIIYETIFEGGARPPGKADRQL